MPTRSKGPDPSAKFKLIVAIAKDPTLTGLERRVLLLVLCQYLNRQSGTAWPGAARLAKDLKVAVESVRRALKRLTESKGYLIAKKGGGRGRATEYALDPRRLAGGDSPDKNSDARVTLYGSKTVTPKSENSDLGVRKTVTPESPQPLSEPVTNPFSENASKPARQGTDDPCNRSTESLKANTEILEDADDGKQETADADGKIVRLNAAARSGKAAGGTGAADSDHVEFKRLMGEYGEKVDPWDEQGRLRRSGGPVFTATWTVEDQAAAFKRLGDLPLVTRSLRRRLGQGLYGPLLHDRVIADLGLDQTRITCAST